MIGPCKHAGDCERQCERERVRLSANTKDDAHGQMKHAEQSKIAIRAALSTRPFSLVSLATWSHRLAVATRLGTFWAALVGDEGNGVKMEDVRLALRVVRILRFAVPSVFSSLPLHAVDILAPVSRFDQAKALTNNACLIVSLENVRTAHSRSYTAPADRERDRHAQSEPNAVIQEMQLLSKTPAKGPSS